MSSKFFTNQAENTLFDKFKGIAQSMVNFYSFHAVVGFFRSSGYFKLRQELNEVQQIQILVGINIDNIFRKHNKAMLLLGNNEEAKNIFDRDFVLDVQKAKYTAEVEQGILQLCNDLQTGKVEMKIHASKDLHAKFYLCLPENHSQHSDGWVIMGSSNISDSGLGVTQPPRYELNVAMKDFDDVDFCKNEFDKLWSEGITITENDIEKSRRKTHIGYQPTPYELYIKVLIDSFGNQVEDDFSINLPEGVSDLKYQKDAVIQGYQMLCEHNGFFLADVVGLGKTIVATMIAQRFLETNGKNTNILVVHPPALGDNWEKEFQRFELTKKTQFISSGSLSKILEGKDNYKDKEEFDMVIVDEAHGFRTDTTNRYDELQRICKSPCCNPGLMRCRQKKIMLLSATPLNNRPNDLLNLILLFQNTRRSTIDGVNNLQSFFAPLIDRYKKEMKNRKALKNTDEIDAIYREIRDKALDKITVRRTRHNIINDEYYKNDLDDRKIKFPEILPPQKLEYTLNDKLNELFFRTLSILTNEENGLKYARYRAVEFLNVEEQKKFKNPKNIGENLKGIYRVHMVKRLESSFFAFKRSLTTFTQITEDMLKMFDEGKIIVAPELKIKDLQAKGWELDSIIEFVLSKGYDEADFLFKPEDFDKNFRIMLENDRNKLQQLSAEWDRINEDPKLDLFVNKLQTELFETKTNPTGKLVVFSESVDTVKYLVENLSKKLNRTDILMVTSENRNKKKEIVHQCFDANYNKESNVYNILITSDVLAEGVNLHRSNVIVNYDSPWNATRLMQRIGRVNRIGSLAGEIHNYMFYPSAEGDAQIQLYNNALIKLQGFHSALGEDAQIYSHEEIVKEFQLFDPKVKDKVDKQLELLREVRKLYNTDRQLYKKIKKLPMKSRAVRNAKNENDKNTTIAFIQSPIKTEYYRVSAEKVESIDFIDAAFILKAKKDEPTADFILAAQTHFEQVNRALNAFHAESIVQQDADSLSNQIHDQTAVEAQKFLRLYKNITLDDEIKQQCSALQSYIEQGIYNNLQKEIKALAREYKNDANFISKSQYEIDIRLNELYKIYNTAENSNDDIGNTEPNIVLSETLI